MSLLTKFSSNIMFIRHGLTDYNQENRFLGITDEPLNSVGKKQAKFSSLWLKTQNIPFDLALTSPLFRCLQTAEIITQHLPISFQTEDLLRERNYGIFEGKSRTEIKSLYPDLWKEYQINKPLVALPEGETALDVESRIKDLFWRKIPDQYPNIKNILVVTHLNPIRSLLYLTNLRDRSIYFQKFQNASITSIHFNFEKSSLNLLDFVTY